MNRKPHLNTWPRRKNNRTRSTPHLGPFFRAASRAIFALCVLLTACSSIDLPNPGGGDPDAPAAVLLLHVEGLEPPITGDRFTFKPTSYRPIEPGSAQRFTGFFLTVATADPGALKATLTNRQSGRRVNLRRLPPPHSVDASQRAERLEPFNDQAVSILKEGQGVFWITGRPSSALPLAATLGVLLPESSTSPLSTLDVYASEIGATPVSGVRIELTDEFFNLAVLGDSVQWGNGLRLERKIWTQVADIIEERLARKVIIQRYALSGAPIVPYDGDGICELPCNGELPPVVTSITTQVDQIIEPARVDLVLMNGCINDVGRVTILNQFEDIEVLQALTEQACGEEMGHLLEKVRQVAPNAAIIVMGYYPIIGLQSDLTGVINLQLIEGTGFDGGAEQLAALAERSQIFADLADASLRAAVARLNDSQPGAPSAAVADPAFGSANVIFAPDAWLWGLTDEATGFESLNLGLDVFPEDPMRWNRLDLCIQDGLTPNLLPCLFASIGHPNEEGARAYVAAVRNELEQLGVIP